MTTTLPNSTGLFPQWQPAYAAQGVATFPVLLTDDTKRPAITHYGKVGLPGSADLATKRQFASVNALGFMAGARSRVTILDVDSSDEKVLTRALDRHGQTPLIVRTASGKFHALYRYNGERRRIRPWGKRLPIDILGRNGFVVAPPSSQGGTAKGQYEIIQGNLRDLERLPVLRGLEPEALDRIPNKEWKDLREHDGRNLALFRQLGKEAHHMKSFDEVLDRAASLNSQFAEPMSADEAIKVARSVWKMQSEGRNHIGRTYLPFDVAEAKQIITEEPDLWMLVSLLQTTNGPTAKFMATNEWLAKTLRWSPSRVRAARRRMLEEGYAREVSAPRPGRATLYRWGRAE